MRRLLGLAVRFSWAAKTKLSLLIVLVAVGMTVFLVVTELSRVSTDGLDDAITRDVGQTGSYQVDVDTDLGLTPVALSARVVRAVAPFTTTPVEVVEVLPALTSDCPPFDLLGSPQFLVRRTSTYQPAPLPFGQDLPAGARFCFGGQVVPASAAYLPTKQEMHRWGSGLFIRADYESIAALATTAPIQYRFVVITGQPADQVDRLQHAVDRALAPAAATQAVSEEGVVNVLRLDTGDSIRAASRGISAVYAAIGWGTLLLGGLGLLVSELIVVRGRMWFFGLARALGARPWHVAALVVADVLLVLTAGTALAVLACAVLQPVAESFAQTAFGISVDLLTTSVVPRLLAGGFVLLVVASAYPAWDAVRQDPLDVLEPQGQ